ncbi:MAG: DNA cytosine methyltransferase [Acidobacteriota bacterium]|nr:DNA cytosine methyltransferase [Acidobacteriota bacterium]
MTGRRPGFYEFFAGGGMARLGLGDDWECLFANEWSAKKACSYRANFSPASELHVEDIWKLSVSDLPGRPDLAWASFPCQDLSLAGNGAGLGGTRSGTLIKFWDLMRELAAAGRKVPIIALENVIGALTSNDGRDFKAMAELAADAGYRFGALVIDAAQFVPQSRPRLFFIAVSEGTNIPTDCEWKQSTNGLFNARLKTAAARLSPELQERWIWWDLPRFPRTNSSLDGIIEFGNQELPWHTGEETHRLLEMMSAVNAAKVRKAQAYGKRIIGTVYKRVRIENGVKVQRAEARFDQVSGCLRTPTGGSSRQTILVVHGSSICSRLMTPREAARLMGIPDSYRLPERYNDGYHLAGDGVVVPVVRFLATHILERLVAAGVKSGLEAA